MPTHPNETAEYFTAISHDFDSKYSDKPDFIERFSIWEKLINKYTLDKKTAYDFGCGAGIFSFKLAQNGMDTLGVDAAEGMLSLAKKIVDKHNLTNLKFRKDTLPLQKLDDYPPVDIIISSSVIEYVEEHDEVLDSFVALLNDKGTMILSFPNKKSFHRLLEKIVFAICGRPSYLKYVKSKFDEQQIRDFAARNELVVHEVHYYGKVFSLYSILLNIFGEKLCNTLFVVVLQKA